MIITLDRLPADAVLSKDKMSASYTDGRNRRIANRVSRETSLTLNTLCRVNGQTYERLMDANGDIIKSEAIKCLPDAKKLFARAKAKGPVTTFTATFKNATYQQVEQVDGDVGYRTTVTANNQPSKSFFEPTRQQAINLALDYMETMDEATLHVKKDKNQKSVKTTKVMETYEGRSHLSFVEIELQVTYWATVDFWVASI